MVHVVDDASASVQDAPELTYAIAQVLARRLSAVTAYLVDIKRQYADSDTAPGADGPGPGQSDAMQPATIKPGSERRRRAGLLKRSFLDRRRSRSTRRLLARNRSRSAPARRRSGGRH